MKLSNIAAISLLSFGLSLAASAKEFRISLAGTGENGDGNYHSLVVNKGFEGPLVYELIPATPEVASAMKANRCSEGARVDASVLARHIEIDHENRGPGMETVKLLVRKLDCDAR